MKKFTLFLFSMFIAITAMAQIETSTSVENPEHMYTIKSGAGFYMTSCSSLGNQENAGRFAFFAVEGSDGAYYVYSIDRKLWVSYTKASSYSNGTNFAKLVDEKDNAEAWNIVLVDGNYQVAPYNTTAVAGKYWNWWGGKDYNPENNTNITIGLYDKGAAGNSGDSGSRWIFEKTEATADVTTISFVSVDEEGNETNHGTYYGIAGKTEPTLFGIYSSSLNNKVWEENTFKAQIEFPFPLEEVMFSPFNNTAIRYYVNGTNVKATKTLPTTETISNYLWTIEPSYEKGVFKFAIKSNATGTYIVTKTQASHSEGDVTVAEEGTLFTVDANNQFKTPEGLYLSASTSTTDDQFVGVWNNQHEGLKNKIYDGYNNYEVTDIAGNVYTGTYRGYYAFVPTFTGAHGYTLTNGAFNADTYAATINFPYTVSKEGETPNDILLSSWNEDKIWHAVGDGIKVQSKNSGYNVDLNCMWAIYPLFDNGAFKFVIKNIATGKHVYSDYSGTIGSGVSMGTNNTDVAKGVVTLNNNATEFVIASDKDFRFAADNNKYISINSTVDTNVWLGIYSSIHNGTNTNSPTYTSYGVNITSAGFATFYAAKAVTIPEGVKAYYIANDGVKTDAVTLTEITTTIPANTGVILEGEEGLYNFAIVEEVGAVDGNQLFGTVAAALVNEEAYVLSAPNGAVGLYKAQMTDGSWLNNGYKAYLPASAVEASPASLSFRFPGTTGVEEVKGENGNVKAIFDLTGRRVEAITAPGIYIVNGKKVLVK